MPKHYTAKEWWQCSAMQTSLSSLNKSKGTDSRFPHPNSCRVCPVLGFCWTMVKGSRNTAASKNDAHSTVPSLFQCHIELPASKSSYIRTFAQQQQQKKKRNECSCVLFKYPRTPYKCPAFLGPLTERWHVTVSSRTVPVKTPKVPILLVLASFGWLWLQREETKTSLPDRNMCILT